MTLLKQLEVLATGSDLSDHFRTVRIKLTIFCFLSLSILLIFIGFSTFETSRKGFERVSPPPIEFEINSGKGAREKFVDYARLVRQRNLEELQAAIFINYSLLVSLLTFLSWVSFYYLLKPISENYREKEEFLKHTTHELRTPLAILKSDLQLSLQEKNIDEIKKINTSALEELDRLHTLASGFLLDLSGENTQSSKVKTDMLEIINRSWSSLNSVNLHKITLSTEGTSYITTNDQTKLNQIIFNALDNSVKYAKPDTEVKIALDHDIQSISIANETELTDYKEGVGIEIMKKNVAEFGGSLKTSLDQSRFVLEIKGL
jgi:signal transduction histidine kinase